MRHGKCSAITVSLEMGPYGSSLKVADNGKGFDISLYKETDESGKLGLVNMRSWLFLCRVLLT